MSLNQSKTKKESEIKYMQMIMQRQRFLDLEEKKNNYDINLMKNIKKLAKFVEFMKDKAYLDFIADNESEKIKDDKVALLVKSELRNIQPYWKLILDKKKENEFIPCDPTLLKLRSSPYKEHPYFMCFHDLESLKPIKSNIDTESIEYYLSLVRKDIFKQPIRQDVLNSAKEKWQQFRTELKKKHFVSKEEEFKYIFTKLPSQSEAMNAEELEDSIYSLDDLNIDFEWDDERQKEIKDQEEVEMMRENKDLDKSSFDRVDQLDRELASLKGNYEEYCEEEFSYY